VEGKHVQILGPKNSDSLFFNYRGTFSVVFLTLVDANYDIICADVGCQGHISDGEVFTHTIRCTTLEKNWLCIPVLWPLRGIINAIPFVSLLTMPLPYQPVLWNHSLGSNQNQVPSQLSRAHRIVDNVVGILAVTCRVFLKPIFLSPVKVKIVVMTCIYLHNFYTEMLMQGMRIHPHKLGNNKQERGNVFKTCKTSPEDLITLHRTLERSIWNISFLQNGRYLVKMSMHKVFKLILSWNV
jgi:hypothetical protein